MSSSDASFDSSSDSETEETEIEYDLEEVMSNASEQKNTSDDDEPEDVFVNEPLADYNWLAQYEAEREKEQELEEKLCPGYALFLVWPFVESEDNVFIWYILSFYGSKDCPKLESDQWPGMTSQTALYPDYFKSFCCSVVF